MDKLGPCRIQVWTPSDYEWTLCGIILDGTQEPNEECAYCTNNHEYDARLGYPSIPIAPKA